MAAANPATIPVAESSSVPSISKMTADVRPGEATTVEAWAASRTTVDASGVCTPVS
jgi:hypothetical protein